MTTTPEQQAEQAAKSKTFWIDCKGYVVKHFLLDTAEFREDGRLIGGPLKGKITVSAALNSLYSLLTTLDTKASALMRLNGVMLAAAAFLLTAHGQTISVLSFSNWDTKAVVLTACLSSVSILLCLPVVSVAWYFLGRVEELEDGKFDYTCEMRSLQKVALRRQRLYRSAWWISFVAGVVFVVEFLALGKQVLFGA